MGRKMPSFTGRSGWVIEVKGYAYVKVPFCTVLDITPQQYQEMEEPKLIAMVNKQLAEASLMGGEVAMVDWMGYKRIE